MFIKIIQKQINYDDQIEFKKAVMVNENFVINVDIDSKNPKEGAYLYLYYYGESAARYMQTVCLGSYKDFDRANEGLNKFATMLEQAHQDGKYIVEWEDVYSLRERISK